MRPNIQEAATSTVRRPAPPARMPHNGGGHPSVAGKDAMSRIIGGAAGGARLATPPGARTRPTSDRVREAVFSALASWAGTGSAPAAEQLRGVAFLDLFAGSGAIGLEAASRGADRVVLVENHAPTARLIAANTAVVRRAASARIDIVTQAARTYLAGASATPFDVVWLDPPYDLPGTELGTLLRAALDHLVEDGLVVVERSARDDAPPWPPALAVTWSKDYGETRVHYARRATSGADQQGARP